MSTTAGPSRPTQSNHAQPPRDFTSKGGPRGRYQQNQLKYGTPLPILFPSSPLHPCYVPPGKSSTKTSRFSNFSIGLGSRAIYPECIGTWDKSTRSVIVSNRVDMDILFQRGFFGKGNLSRSEPTWRARRIDLLKGGESSAAEKIREKRRLERKQFKIDRAAAMLQAAKTAEAVITTSQGQSQKTGEVAEEGEDGEAEEEAEEEEEDGDDSQSVTASTTTTTTTAPSDPIDIHKLTPQTFLVRPTRPDSNRNRGRNAFKRKPKPKTPSVPSQLDPNAPIPTHSTPAPTTHELAESAQGSETADKAGRVEKVDPETGISKAELEEEEEDWFDEALIEEVEHLQLGPEEAWFLSTGLGVLRIRDPETDVILPANANLPLFLTPVTSSDQPSLRQDDPFLVSYAVYHYFRTLGWVVKPGIKFCCDWLLYRKGPVFSHAAFSIVMIPTYEEEGDKAVSPYRDEDWYNDRLSWKWINTIMRVNSLVQKTVIMVYITIPSNASIPDRYKLDDGSLDLKKNDMETILRRFTVSEVSVQRFGPARRRD